MPLSALRSISDAIDATRTRLIPPTVSEWGRFAVIVFFLGLAGTPVPANPQFLDPRLWELNEALAEEVDVQALLSTATTPAGWPRIVLAGVILAFVVALTYVFIGVVMRFVVLEGLRGKAVRIQAAGRRHFLKALRVFGFRAVLWTLGAGTVVLVTASALDLGLGAGLTPSRPVLAAAGGVAAAVWLVDIVTRQFVIPIMIATETGVTAGWRALLGTVRGGWREYVVYAVARPLLSGAVGVLAGIVSAVALLGIGLVFGTIGGAVVLAAGGLDALSTGVLAVLGVLGVGFLAAAITGFAVVSVPFQLYLWYYTLLVLGDVDQRFDLITDRRRRIRTNGPTFEVVD